MQIPVSQMQRFCMHDGPGVRTVVFFKGCPLSCRWCHNPETQSFENQIMFDAEKCIGCGSCDACPHGAQTERKNCIGCGACTALCPTGARENTLSMMPLEQVLEIVLRDRAFYGASGGITLSGGEPMAHPMEAIALLKRAKEEGITTAMETCAFFSEEYLPELKKYCDVFLWDIKDLNDVRHKENTGVSNQIILKNLKQLDRLGAKIILRCIMLRGINMQEDHLMGLRRLLEELSPQTKIELLPYHCMFEKKVSGLGMSDAFNHERYIPTAEDMEQARKIIGI